MDLLLYYHVLLELKIIRFMKAIMDLCNSVTSWQFCRHLHRLIVWFCFLFVIVICVFELYTLPSPHKINRSYIVILLWTTFLSNSRQTSGLDVNDANVVLRFSHHLYCGHFIEIKKCCELTVLIFSWSVYKSQKFHNLLSHIIYYRNDYCYTIVLFDNLMTVILFQWNHYLIK